jgi:glycosyltransferase involved in cell wall biosynthesis
VISVLELRSVRGTGGGPEKTILLGAGQHDRRRFAITVCYLRDLRDDQFSIAERARQLNVDYVEVRERHSFDPGVWPRLVRLTRERRIDIVHGHEYKTNLLALLLARRTGAIPIATSHGWTGNTVRERRLYYPADRQLLRRMPRVIAVSSDVRDALIRSGTAASRITVLLNGIDPAMFRRDPVERQAIRAELDMLPHHEVIGVVGRLEHQKRVDLLLESVRSLGRARPNVRLVIAGDGRLRGQLEQLAHRLGIGAGCRFLGHRGDIARLHHAFDVFVQSSEYEGTPNAVLEAMAMQTPIVATDVGGTRELAAPGVDALIVPPGDATALSEAIAAVLADPAAAGQRAQAARARVETRLSFGERTRELERIYDELMAGRGRLERAHSAPSPIGVSGA